jgi:hypothetical protein
MSTSLLYHAFGIRGYQYTCTDYPGGQTVFTIHQDPKTCRCSSCGSPRVHCRGRVERLSRTVPVGRGTTFVVLPIPRWQWSCNPGPPGQAIRAHLGHLNIAID